MSEPNIQIFAYDVLIDFKNFEKLNFSFKLIIYAFLFHKRYF
jgi:hypothetical protein